LAKNSGRSICDRSPTKGTLFLSSAIATPAFQRAVHNRLALIGGVKLYTCQPSHRLTIRVD